MNFNACSTVGDALFGRAKEPPPPASAAKENELEQALTSLPSSRFEWAVQAFEAGQYETALDKFSVLSPEGANNPRFQLIPYYLGMSHYQLQQWDGAISQLKKFISLNGKSSEAATARVTLLLALEQKQAWPEISTLAGEMQEQLVERADSVLLQLIWAEALLQQKEFQGAGSLLEKAEAGMQSIPFIGFDSDLNPEGEDLHGRFATMRAYTAISQCLEKYSYPKPEPKKKKSKQASLEQILDGQSECLEKALSQTLESYALYAPRWTAAIEAHWVKGLDDFYAAALPTQYKARLKPVLQRSFYRLAAFIQAKTNIKDQPMHAQKHLEKIEKHIESLLMKLSLLSSSDEQP